MITLDAVLESAEELKGKFLDIQRLSPDFALPEDNLRTRLKYFSEAYDKHSGILQKYDRELKREHGYDQCTEHLANRQSILNDTAAVKKCVDEVLRANRPEKMSNALNALDHAVESVGGICI